MALNHVCAVTQSSGFGGMYFKAGCGRMLAKSTGSGILAGHRTGFPGAKQCPGCQRWLDKPETQAMLAAEKAAREAPTWHRAGGQGVMDAETKGRYFAMHTKCGWSKQFREGAEARAAVTKHVCKATASGP